MDVNDVRGTKAARSIFGKHGIDLRLADVRVTHGVCFVRGCLCALPKCNVKSVEETANLVCKVIRQQATIKECVLECTFKEEFFR
jgi:hypothetical protein